ncbi:MAG: NUDIX hydrolase [Eubacteriales bacterium]|nr:NUDIX hydrolase [Eubacteriales bacterium]MDD4422513.1 NUDIX hydrolase [Eubacteriales bacterium]HBR32105.1 hypothetical protein [Clostridiales bacterium]
MPVDKDGLTEEEFLRAYDPSVYERPSVTVDIILFDNKRTLLIRRGGHPFIGKWAFPGGFVEPYETVEQAAYRELFEETGLSEVEIKQLRCFSEPHRDPRTRIITIAFTGRLITRENHIIAGDDAENAAWFDISVLPVSTGVYRDGSYEDEYEIKLTNGREKLICPVLRRSCPAPYPVDANYVMRGDSPLAGDHALLLAAAIDSCKDIFT